MIPTDDIFDKELGVSSQDASTALGELLADRRFLATERSKALLRYLVGESLGGRSDRIKAYTIAVDLLGRTATFDPSTDPIVRVEASRLRFALNAYNTQCGGSGVTIDLPRGSYVPTLRAQTATKTDRLPCHPA